MEAGGAHPFSQLLTCFEPRGAVYWTHDAAFRLPANGGQMVYVVLQGGGVNLYFFDWVGHGWFSGEDWFWLPL